MTGNEMRAARRTLGLRWFGRELLQSELGRALRLSGADIGQTVHDMERRGARPISGPISANIDQWLAGGLPPDGLDAIKDRGS